ncbi:MAG TPA: acyl-CoA dehydrogenase family protein [Ilumatobacteraceae bacterium]
MIDADDLALLTTSFEAAMERSGDRRAVDAALFDLGWSDLIDVAPRVGAAAAFELLGATNSPASLLDDVVAASLGLPVSLDTCIVLPAPTRADPAGRAASGRLQIDGLASARIDTAQRVIAPASSDGAIVLVELAPDRLGAPRRNGLDAAGPFRRVMGADLEFDVATVVDGSAWHDAVRDARTALAHQLIGASRRMLGLAQAHAMDRIQFGRSIASFQAVRHKLAESLVAIEAAAAAADAAVGGSDDLVAALAKSLAGKAARVTATQAQQVLAGIGFTAEHPFHLLLKRTMVIDTLFGSARTLPAEIGRALLAQRSAPRLIEL